LAPTVGTTLRGESGGVLKPDHTSIPRISIVRWRKAV
jgi:hypothetical protein